MNSSFPKIVHKYHTVEHLHSMCMNCGHSVPVNVPRHILRLLVKYLLGRIAWWILKGWRVASHLCPFSSHWVSYMRAGLIEPLQEPSLRFNKGPYASANEKWKQDRTSSKDFYINYTMPPTKYSQARQRLVRQALVLTLWINSCRATVNPVTSSILSHCWRIFWKKKDWHDCLCLIRCWKGAEQTMNNKQFMTYLPPKYCTMT